MVTPRDDMFAAVNAAQNVFRRNGDGPGDLIKRQHEDLMAIVSGARIFQSHVDESRDAMRALRSPVDEIAESMRALRFPTDEITRLWRKVEFSVDERRLRGYAHSIEAAIFRVVQGATGATGATGANPFFADSVRDMSAEERQLWADLDRGPLPNIRPEARTPWSDDAFPLKIDRRATSTCVVCDNPVDQVIDAHLSGPGLLMFEQQVLPCPFCKGVEPKPDGPGDSSPPEPGPSLRVIRGGKT